MIHRILGFTIAAALLLLIGCRGQMPVYNVTSAPVTANRVVSSDEVGKAIIRAGARYGWQMIQKGSGTIEGTLVNREHRAVIDVKYNAKSYSITYKDSEKLDYDGTNIHPNYNGWIQRLDNQIRVELSTM
ncbi:MAG TPA: hypothetical protein VKD25_06040 [Burkholderiales bacterium]|nr:hypothetical protein [Burkholderiales bacterium]